MILMKRIFVRECCTQCEREKKTRVLFFTNFVIRSFAREREREREIKRAQNVTIMAPESFNASLPERDILIAKCVFCYLQVRNAKMLTQGASSFLPFFHFFSYTSLGFFCPYFQTLNSCVSSFFVRSTLCAAHIYSFVPSLSLSSRAETPVITSIREKKKKKNSVLIDRS